MCGIAGIFSPGARLDLARLEAMTRVQSHRGPDGEGYVLLPLGGSEKPFTVRGSLAPFTSRSAAAYALGFGHRRLAILDLTPLGDQPMGTEDGRLWITYNGEIYNAPELRRELTALGHGFRSTSDTEVILESYRAWGAACLPRFNGMFAFALWDGRNGTLFCARDRFGIKPFYYRREADRFVFASEIKALVQDAGSPRRPNDQALYDFLIYGRQDHTSGTFFDGVLQLRPGDSLTVRSAGEGRPVQYRLESWWRPRIDRERITAADAARQLRGLLEDAVRLHLRADVPIGSCLSGGLDSSTLVCLAMHRLRHGGAAPAFQTFSSCFDDPRIDERPYIRAVTAAAGALGHEVTPDAADLWASLPDIIWQHDEPIAGPSMLVQWAVMREARRAGAKVLLDGQGADELLLGYPGYLGSRVGELIATGSWPSAYHEWSSWRRIHGPMPPTVRASLIRALLPASAADVLQRQIMNAGDWLGTGFRHRGAPRPVQTGPAVDRHVVRSVTEDLPALLHAEDRSAMAWSIEARVPFLEHRLADWLLRLPPELKLADGVSKRVLRDAMAGVLPERVHARQDKIGFAAPQDEWLRRAWRPQIDVLLRSDQFRSRPYWRGDKAAAAYRRYCEHGGSIGTTVWRWISVEQWLRRFCD